MGNYTIFLMFENPRRSRQARNFTENDPKILDLKSSSEQIIPKIVVGCPCNVAEVGSFIRSDRHETAFFSLLCKSSLKEFHFCVIAK